MTRGGRAGWLAGLAGIVVASGLGCADAGEPPTRVSAPDSADQVLYGMVHHVTVEGVQRAQLEADTAYVYEGTQTIDLVAVTVRFYSATGQLTSTVTADSGRYDLRSRNMEAHGHVVAVTPDGRKLTTSVLRYDRASERISGPEAFTFDAPDKHLEGGSFTADTEFRDVVATSPRRGTARGVEIPRP